MSDIQNETTELWALPPRVRAKTLAEAAATLRRPFVPDAIEFLVIASYPRENPNRGVVAPYIASVSVEERLDYAVGPEGWAAEFRAVDHNTVACRLTVLGVAKESIGQGENRWSQEANAFKRAAKRFGIGRYLYKMRQPHLPIAAGGLHRHGRTVSVPDQLAERLRAGYAERVRRDYEPVYGPMLDHDEEPGQLGDEGDPKPQPDPDGAAAIEAPRPDEGDGSGAAQPGEGAGEVLVRVIAAGGYKVATARALAAFMFGEETALESLPAERLAALTDVLSSAAAGDLPEAQLSEALERAAGKPDRAQAIQQLCGWVAAKARAARTAQQQAA
jgi:hypothetical protein